ncbi:hypothetical protein SLEP1_g50754 [Rubroshorea leprosula]|uniref:Uncharacterized protein n=1 Tax=Rubroshorea leprosula TaxID=152421 RepID=A0AAV5M348_9ROSI|nr:hypothetical protein SLEP1_g50754 [Rubroshorea leprosula]
MLHAEMLQVPSLTHQECPTNCQDQYEGVIFVNGQYVNLVSFMAALDPQAQTLRYHLSIFWRLDFFQMLPLVPDVNP